MPFHLEVDAVFRAVPQRMSSHNFLVYPLTNVSESALRQQLYSFLEGLYSYISIFSLWADITR